MKCPKCDGKGTKVLHTISGTYHCDMDCPHCRGTGEIQEGDWWMCGFDDNSKHRAPRILENFEGKVRWCVLGDPWDESGFSYNEPHNSVLPLYRMDEVK